MQPVGTTAVAASHTPIWRRESTGPSFAAYVPGLTSDGVASRRQGPCHDSDSDDGGGVTRGPPSGQPRQRPRAYARDPPTPASSSKRFFADFSGTMETVSVDTETFVAKCVQDAVVATMPVDAVCNFRVRSGFGWCEVHMAIAQLEVLNLEAMVRQLDKSMGPAAYSTRITAFGGTSIGLHVRATAVGIARFRRQRSAWKVAIVVLLLALVFLVYRLSTLRARWIDEWASLRHGSTGNGEAATTPAGLGGDGL